LQLWRITKLAQTLKKNRFKEKICKKKAVRALRDALQLPFFVEREPVIREKAAQILI
jgi:hypothetical protein